jgi:hypothetical protein
MQEISGEELKAVAGSYHALGLAVVLFKLSKNGEEYDKQNLSSWKKWETERQTDEEFMALNWKADGCWLKIQLKVDFWSFNTTAFAKNI